MIEQVAGVSERKLLKKGLQSVGHLGVDGHGSTGPGRTRIAPAIHGADKLMDDGPQEHVVVPSLGRQGLVLGGRAECFELSMVDIFHV